MTDYTGAYDPRRNPNSAMQRVVATVYDDATARDVTPALAGTPQDGRTDHLVTVELDGICGELLDEASAAGFRFNFARPTGDGRLSVEFGVPASGVGD